MAVATLAVATMTVAVATVAVTVAVAVALTLGVPVPQLVQDVSRVKAGIVAQLAGDNLWQGGSGSLTVDVAI
jgi:hypothetical protein